MSTQPRVAVVMSTYNGAAYLAEQIESILSQEGVDVSLFVRDDGSTDETRSILDAYAQEGKLTVSDGPNLGPTKSFLLLIAQVADHFPFVALADQDDVWHTNKLARALSFLAPETPASAQLQPQQRPAAYCAEYIYCDKNLHPQGRSHLNKRGVDFDAMLYENVTSGNTMVLNQALAQKIAQAGMERVYTHDWWISLVATALGTLYFDDFPCLEYRRLDNNASPSGRSGAAIMQNRIRRYVNGSELALITSQLQKLMDEFGPQMPDQKQATLKFFLTASRFEKARSPLRLRQTAADEAALRALFLLGKL
ncbi:MAG: glycosyltransferase family 2 protein [Atopobiaceae bacterium]|jgi:glycosyltransferase involved in cell wall biosynthesis